MSCDCLRHHRRDTSTTPHPHHRVPLSSAQRRDNSTVTGVREGVSWTTRETSTSRHRLQPAVAVVGVAQRHGLKPPLPLPFGHVRETHSFLAGSSNTPPHTTTHTCINNGFHAQCCGRQGTPAPAAVAQPRHTSVATHTRAAGRGLLAAAGHVVTSWQARAGTHCTSIWNSNSVSASAKHHSSSQLAAVTMGTKTSP